MRRSPQPATLGLKCSGAEGLWVGSESALVPTNGGRSVQIRQERSIACPSAAGEPSLREASRFNCFGRL